MIGSEGRRDSRRYRALVYAVLIGGALPILLPFYWLVLSSLKTKERVEAYPPDWLPVVPRSFLTVAGTELQVKVFDDGVTSGTRVCRVKVLHDRGPLPTVPAAALTVTRSEECYAPVDGVRCRVLPIEARPAPDGTIAVELRGALETVRVPAAALRTTTESRCLWQVLGVELPVRTEVEPRPDAGVVPVRVVGPAEPLRVAPATLADEGRSVRYRGRTLPVEVLSGDGGGGWWTVALRTDVAYPVPVGELRIETRTRYWARLNGADVAVRPLAAAADSDSVPVELVGRPRVVRVPAAVVERVPVELYSVRLLGEDVRVEPAERPVPDDPQAAVAFRVPGPLTVVADRLRQERPLEPQWHNYAAAWRKQTFDRYVVNTLFIAALVVLGTVLSCGLVGYAFARLEFRGRDALFLVLLATLMIPGQVTSIPTFVLFVKFGWLDSYKPLILPALLAGSAFFIFLYRQFMLTIPVDLEDSARIDGCGPLQTWWLIMMPLSKPIVVTVAVFTFIGVWNDFLGPLLYINSDEKQTVALGLQSFKSAFQYDDPQVLMAASVMMMLPSIVMFFLAQRAFIRGVVVSGVKG